MVEQVVGLEFIVTGAAEATAAIKRVAQNQDKLRNDILRGADALQRIQSNWEKTNRLVNQGTISNQAAARSQVLLAREYALLNGYVKANGALNTQKALAELRAAQATREAAAAAAIAAKEAKRLADRQLELRMRFQEGYAQFTRQREAMRSLREAYRSGIITLQQYEAQLARIRATNQGNVAGTNNLGVAMQQTGYQVGDFMVQIQGGTNPMVAFGQQATQLVGVLYLLPPATLAASRSIMGLSVSVGFLVMSLGIIIPIATAIGAYFMRMSGEAKTLSQRLDETTSSSDKLKETFEIINDTALDQTFGNLAEEVKSLSSAMLILDGNSQLKNLTAFLDKAEEAASVGPIRQFFSEMINTPTFGLLGSSEAELDEATFSKLGYGIGRQQYLGYIDGLKQSANQGNREQIVELFDNLISSLGSNVTPAGYLLADQMRQAALAVADITAEMNGTAKSAMVAVHLEGKRVESIQLYYDNLKKVSDLQQERKAGVQAILDAVEAEKKSMTDTLELNRRTLQFGKDSRQVREKEAEIAREQYRLEQLSLGIKGNHLRDAMAIYDENAKVTAELAASEDKAKGLADALKDAASAMSSLSSFGDSLDKALAVSLAKVQALKAGTDATIAGSIAGMRADLSGRVQQGLASGVPIGTIMAEIDSSSSTISQLESSETERKAIEDAQREAGKKGSTSETGREALEKLTRQIESKRRLVSLTEEQARYEELLFKIQETNASKRDPLSQKEIEEAAKKLHLTEEQTRVIEEGLKRQQEIYSLLESSMESAFMSMVDGTKSVEDAFKSMAAEIIKELYRVLVVKQLVGSVDGGTGIAGFIGSFFANGAAFSNGNVVPFANGGVVGSPTTFPMAGGKTGLMGEAGPEAIMPLKRGKDGKLGVAADGGGSVNIVQNFNISANGDDSVKRIVRQQIPQIAEATKAAVVDAKRRGGSYGRAFG